jgi:mannose/fructose/N-acetylgalactosamine-specific phosphotransferase system component IID
MPTRSHEGISLPWSMRARMIFRSLFIQATNNFERMLSLGFLFALWPLIKMKYPEPEARKKAIMRHLSFFNTQPYLANCILGVVANVELRGGENVDGDVAKIKEAMMGAFGALGDDLFWTGLLPAAALVALIFYGVFPDYAFIGALVALVLYNLFQFWARVRFFNVGLRLGPRITTYLKMLKLPRVALIAKLAAAFLLGAFTVVLMWRTTETYSFGAAGVLAVSGAVLLSFVLQSIGVRPGVCWYLVAGLGVGVVLFTGL